MNCAKVEQEEGRVDSKGLGISIGVGVGVGCLGAKVAGVKDGIRW